MEKDVTILRSYINIDSIISDEKSRKQFKQALDKICAKERKIIELRIYKNLSVKEIALQSNLSERNIKKTLRQGLLRLRNCFDASYYEEAQCIFNNKLPYHITF